MSAVAETPPESIPVGKQSLGEAARVHAAQRIVMFTPAWMQLTMCE